MVKVKKRRKEEWKIQINVFSRFFFYTLPPFFSYECELSEEDETSSKVMIRKWWIWWKSRILDAWNFLLSVSSSWLSHCFTFLNGMYADAKQQGKKNRNCYWCSVFHQHSTFFIFLLLYGKNIKHFFFK